MKLTTPRLDQYRKRILAAPAACHLFMTLWVGASSAAAIPPEEASAFVGNEFILQNDLVNEQLTVRELMHLDMDQALQLARNARRNKQPSLNEPRIDASRSSFPTEPPILTALYGLGKTRFARVQSGKDSLLFMQGRSAPVGMKPALAPYRLRGIQGKCVTLDGNDGESTLCLSSPAWER